MKTTDLTVTSIRDFRKLPADAVIITDSDHYRGNSGTQLFYTDLNGRLDFMCEGEDIPSYWHWHEYPDDRGLKSIIAITSPLGGLYAYRHFRMLCKRYVDASNALKNFTETRYCPQEKAVVNREDLPDWFQSKYLESFHVQYAPEGRYFNKNFWQTDWYHRFKNIAKAETIERKKREYEEELNLHNDTIIKILTKKKREAKQWFLNNEIPISVAYDRSLLGI